MKALLMAVILGTFVSISGCAVKRFDSLMNQVELTPKSSTKRTIYDSLGQPHSAKIDSHLNETFWFYFDGNVRLSPASLIPLAGLLVGGSDVNINVTKLAFSNESGLLSSVDTTNVSRFISHHSSSKVDKYSEMANDLIENELLSLGEQFDEELARKVVHYHLIVMSDQKNEASERSNGR